MDFIYLAYVAIVFQSFASESNAARIFAYFPTAGKSHLIIHCAIADTLANAGHDVTVIGALPNVNKNAKYHYIEIPIEAYSADYTKELMNKATHIFQGATSTISKYIDTTHSHMKQPKMQEFLHKHGANSFDLIILGWLLNDFQLGLAAHFKAPIIYSLVREPNLLINEIVGNPNEVAYVPDFMLNCKQPLNFWQRLIAFLYRLSGLIYFESYINNANEVYYNYHFPSPQYPSFSDIRKNVSLVFTNHHQISQGPIQPLVPAIIEVGGIQIKEQPYPLPSDIAEILDNSKEGVIYFSLGSRVQGDVLDETKARIMFNVLSKLPYTILWKWSDAQYPGTSSNIIYKSWLPQDDLLSHPNIKLFITHAGLGSVVESQYHAVPMVGLPLFGDQSYNMAGVEMSGFGLKVDYNTLTEESFRAAIVEVIENPKYRERIGEFSKLYRDRPMTSRQMVVYWTEYVLRYNGAKHLQSPAVHMNLLQLLSLDVIAFLLAILAVILVVFIKICKCLCCRKRKSQLNVDEFKKDK